jgi:hypothetical protein
MAMLISLIALTGTDFSRNLPQMSGSSVYGWLPTIWPALAAAYNPVEAALREDQAADLVALLYKTKFPKHARATSLCEVLAELQDAPLSARVKDTLPHHERVVCTIRNTNWILSYWTCEPAPDPIQPMFGFRLQAAGAPEYDDSA